MRLALSSKLKEAMSEQTALAFILFAMFYNPCLAATMIFRREAGGGVCGVVIYFYLCGGLYLRFWRNFGL